jgi:hypothetical protein
LEFAVRIPPSWRFLEPGWSPAALMKRSLDPGSEVARRMQWPLVCAQSTDERQDRAIPTMQVTVRPMEAPATAGFRSTVVEGILNTLQQHPDLRPLDVSSHARFGPYPAIRLRARFTSMLALPGNKPVPHGAESRMRVIFALGRAYTIGLSSSDDPAAYRETEFNDILGSLRIGGASADSAS